MRKLSWTEEVYIHDEVTRRHKEYWESYFWHSKPTGREKKVTSLTIQKAVRKELLKNTLVKNMYNSLKKLPDFDESQVCFFFNDARQGEGELSYHKSPVHISVLVPVSEQFCHMWEILNKLQGWGANITKNVMMKYSILFASWKGKKEERPKKIEELIEFIRKDYYGTFESELIKELKNLK